MKTCRDWILRVISFGVVVALFILGCSFFPIWRHKGDSDAQAYGAFLSYIATAIMVLVTLVYVYFTRDSLEVARAASKQQEKQWNQKVTVEPKFWLLAKGNATHEFPPNRAIGTSIKIYQPCEYDALEMVIWNYSEQSFLIHAIELDIHTTNGRRTQVRDVNAVVRPHDTIKVDVSLEILKLIGDPSAQGSEYLFQSLLPSPFSLISAIRYTDWQTINRLSDLLVNTVRTEGRHGGGPSRISIAVERRSDNAL